MNIHRSITSDRCEFEFDEESPLEHCVYRPIHPHDNKSSKGACPWTKRYEKERMIPAQDHDNLEDFVSTVPKTTQGPLQPDDRTLQRIFDQVRAEFPIETTNDYASSSAQIEKDLSLQLIHCLKCNYVTENFPSFFDTSVHLCVVSFKSFKCSLCSKELNNRQHVKEHFRFHNKIVLFLNPSAEIVSPSLCSSNCKSKKCHMKNFKKVESIRSRLQSMTKKNCTTFF